MSLLETVLRICWNLFCFRPSEGNLNRILQASLPPWTSIYKRTFCQFWGASFIFGCYKALRQTVLIDLFFSTFFHWRGGGKHRTGRVLSTDSTSFKQWNIVKTPDKVASEASTAAKSCCRFWSNIYSPGYASQVSYPQKVSTLFHFDVAGCHDLSPTCKTVAATQRYPPCTNASDPQGHGAQVITSMSRSPWKATSLPKVRGMPYHSTPSLGTLSLSNFFFANAKCSGVFLHHFGCELCPGNIISLGPKHPTWPDDSHILWYQDMPQNSTQNGLNFSRQPGFLPPTHHQGRVTSWPAKKKSHWI